MGDDAASNLFVARMLALPPRNETKILVRPMKSPSRFRVTVLLIVLVPVHANGQVADVHRTWLGVWKLNPQQSTFDDRAPAVVQGQILTIEATRDALILTGDTTLRDGRRVHEVAKVSLNGEPTIGPGGVVTVFKAIDRSSFDIIITVTTPAIGDATGANRFVFAPDGRSLVETKTQTRRVALPSSETRTGTEAETVSVLVFERQQ